MNYLRPPTPSPCSIHPTATPSSASFGRGLRNLAMILTGATLLSGCTPRTPSEMISAEQFRTNFPAYAGKSVVFEAYYTKESTGLSKDGYGHEIPVFRYEFFSDQECSLKVGTITSTETTDRDKVLVTVPIAQVDTHGIAVQWNELTFRGVDDVARPVSTKPIERRIEDLRKIEGNSGGLIRDEIK